MSDNFEKFWEIQVFPSFGRKLPSRNAECLVNRGERQNKIRGRSWVKNSTIEDGQIDDRTRDKGSLASSRLLLSHAVSPILSFPLSHRNIPLESILFDTKDNDDATQEAPSVRPCKSLRLDLECGGHWVLAGDVDGDGEAEIVSAQNVDHEDVHYTSSVAAQKLDGTVLWRWGNPNLGQQTWQIRCGVPDP